MSIAAADLYHDPGDREEFSRRLMDDRKLQGIELKLKKKDGTLIWCRESCHAVHDDCREGGLLPRGDRGHHRPTNAARTSSGR